MDTLSEILKTINLSGTVYKRINLSTPWGIEFDSCNFARFHMVVSGQCWLNIEDSNKQIRFSAGDVVVFPRGGAHSLYDNPNTKLVPGDEVVRAIKNNRPLFEGDEVDTIFVGGYFEFDRNIDHPLIDALPHFIHITNAERTGIS